MDQTETFEVGERVMAKLDDAPWREATIVSIEPWGRGVLYNCQFRAQGWVWGTQRVRKLEADA